MAITVTHQSRSYEPGGVRRRYVKYDDAGAYSWCEVGDHPKFDLRQGTCTIDDLSPDVAMTAIARRNEGVWPFYVEWPL